ncbi:AbrB/MazE/SpoVT family DNA-binding domain-containing protein [Chloroflexota bacterium]
MKTRVQKWGNSLALRIPKPFATEVGLQRETTVEISLANGKLIITPIAKPN